MQLSMFAQINLIIIALVGLLFCVFGYKYAKFLMPVCGMIIIESALYLVIAGYLEHTEFTAALFYGVTAVASYVILFFVMRLTGFFTGMLGSALLSYFVISTVGIANIPFAIPIAATLIILTGLVGAVYKRIGVIIATTLFGAGIAGAISVFLILAPSAQYAGGQSVISAINSIIGQNSLVFLIVVGVLAIGGVLLQLMLTGQNQVLIKRIKITLESKSKVSI